MLSVDILVYIVALIGFVFLAYSFIGIYPYKYKKFDLLFVFIVVFFTTGRILELSFITDLTNVGWSMFPVIEENQQILFFTKFPWLFFNFTQILYNFNWILFRFSIGMIVLKLFFNFKANEYKEIRSVIFYVYILFIGGLSFWINRGGELFEQTFSSYLFFIVLISFGVFIYFKILKKISITVTWGTLGLLGLNIYFLIFAGYSQMNSAFIIEILTAFILIFTDYSHYILPKSKRQEKQASRTEVAQRMLSIKKDFANQKSSKNILNEINSKHRKN